MRVPLPASTKDKLRPIYNAVLNAITPEGKTVTINGTDTIKLSPAVGQITGKQEPDVWHRLMDAVRPGDTCLDVGANIGLYTLAFANRLRGRGRVLSFEPDPATFQLLQR